VERAQALVFRSATLRDERRGFANETDDFGPRSDKLFEIAAQVHSWRLLSPDVLEAAKSVSDTESRRPGRSARGILYLKNET